MKKFPTIQEIEQEAVIIRDGLTVGWWAMYAGCRERGFSKAQAMSLVKAWIQRPATLESEE